MTIFNTFFRFRCRDTTWNAAKKTAIGARHTVTSRMYSGNASWNSRQSAWLSAASGSAGDTYVPEAGYTIARISTARIGPTEHSATRPKLSWAAFLSLRMEATPRPSAMMKGTVMGPVVTPPESKAMARKSPGTEAASTSTTA